MRKIMKNKHKTGKIVIQCFLLFILFAVIYIGIYIGCQWANREVARKNTFEAVTLKEVDTKAFVTSTIQENIYSNQTLDASDLKSTKRLIVQTDDTDKLYEYAGVESIVTCGNINILSFDTEENLSNTADLLYADTDNTYVRVDTLQEIAADVKKTSEEMTEAIDLKNETVKTKEDDIIIAVIDSGYTMTSNNEQYSSRVFSGIDFSGSGSIQDENGHGTVISDIILSITPENVKVVPIKAANSDGLSSISQVFTAVLYAIDNGADIINISMTAFSMDETVILESACAYAKEKGVFVVTCAGNDSEPVEMFTPANIESVITVGAVTSDMKPANYSNYGGKLDFVTYGAVNIDDTNLYGTSVSAAIVTAQLANSNCDYSKLKASVVDIFEAGKDNQSGYGFIDIDNLQIIEDVLSINTFKKSLLGSDWKSMSDAEFNELVQESSSYVAAAFIQNLSESDKEIAVDKAEVFSETFSIVENITEDKRTAVLTEYDTYLEYLEQLEIPVVRVQGTSTKKVYLQHIYVGYVDSNGNTTSDTKTTELKITVVSGKGNNTALAASVTGGDYEFMTGGSSASASTASGGNPDCAVKEVGGTKFIHCNFDITKHVNKHSLYRKYNTGITDNDFTNISTSKKCNKNSTQIHNIGTQLSYNGTDIDVGKFVIATESNGRTEKSRTAATCMKTGVINFKCNACTENTDYTITLPIDPNNHNMPTDYSVKTKATCTADGVYSKRCKNKASSGTQCTHEDTATIDARGHAPGVAYQNNDWYWHQDCTNTTATTTHEACTAKDVVKGENVGTLVYTSIYLKSGVAAPPANVAVSSVSTASISLADVNTYYYNKGYHVNSNSEYVCGTTAVGANDLATVKGANVLKLQNANGTSATISPNWKINTYTIDYVKGATDATEPADQICTYNSDVTMANLLGRSYTITLNSNFGSTDYGIASTDVTTKSTYKIENKTNLTGAPEVNYSISGNITGNGWKITGQDSDITQNLNPAFGKNVTKPNYTAVHNGKVTATAQWIATEVILPTPSMNGYIFKGWYTSKTGGTKVTSRTITPETTAYTETLYAHWEPITYKIRFNGNKNWNTGQGSYTQTCTYDKTTELTDNKFSRANATTYNSIYYEKGYAFLGWGTTTTQKTLTYSNKQTVKNLTATNNTVINLYALWKKEITLTINFNGGQFNNDSASKVLEYTMYNSELNHTFNIKQYYGSFNGATYNSKGLNTKLTKTVNGQQYRFLGYSLNPNATVPDKQFDVYSSNRKNDITIKDNTTLYAVWEPVLQMTAQITAPAHTLEIQLDRDVPITTAIGNFTILNGTRSTEIPSSATASVNSATIGTNVTNKDLVTYTVSAKGASNIKFSTAADSRILDIYTHGNNNTWFDKLNTTDKFEYAIDNFSNITSSFTIPQYIGTKKSYKTSNPESATGTSVYAIKFTCTQPSYYYSKYWNSPESTSVYGILFLNPTLPDDNTNILPPYAVEDGAYEFETILN